MPQKHGGLEELSVGMQGILITTGDQEKLCVSEAYSLLNEVREYCRSCADGIMYIPVRIASLFA